MAESRPKLGRLAALAAKAETTTGVLIPTTAADAAFISYNPVVTPDNPVNEREMPAGLGSNKAVPGGDSATLTFESDLHGSGTAGTPPLWATTFLPACDFVLDGDGVTFSRFVNTRTLTMCYYEDGLKRTLFGARGTVKLLYVSGQPVRLQWEFKGKYAEEEDATILAPTFPTILPPIFAGATVTLGAYVPILSRIEFDMANEVILRENGTDDTAYESAAIVAWKPTLTMDPEAVPVATRDWKAILKAGTEESLTVAVGADAGNIITVASSTFQTVKKGRALRNKLLVDAITAQLNGNTPFTIAFDAA